ncbi:nitroreductase [Acidaminobacter sp. JC074]|uniref:nitroreductase family protein n=1 Tax=Acidaminobacter sp. JC074 TaxID=2530199 RepID=UPI001F0F73AC|nr:nitroreductase family protein [Acidaminobacter sp. JC074]MCH4887606.1 nitroreductase [Acidaminobacter sp. JC074]
MKTYELMRRRVSIRKFNDKPIDSEIMDKIIAAAIHAPTAGNMVPYSILKVKDKETLKILSETCDHQPFIADADTALVFLVDINKWHRYLMLNDVEDYAKKTGRKYLGPTIADAILGINDALIASENSVMAAEDFGIGSCYIGDIMENFETHKKLFKLPDYVFPAAMLVFGHYDHRPEPRYRFDTKHIVSDETYHTLSDEELHDMFSEKEKLYNPNISEDIKNYAQQFYNRKMGAPFFEEMNRSIELMLNMFKRP